MKWIAAPALVLTLAGCCGPWAQLPVNPEYDPDDWRVETPAPTPAPAPAPDPFVPDTQTTGTSADRASLPSNPKGANE